MDHLGSVPSGFGGSPNSTLATSKQAELGGFAAGKLGFPKKKVSGSQERSLLSLF